SCVRLGMGRQLWPRLLRLCPLRAWVSTASLSCPIGGALAFLGWARPFARTQRTAPPGNIHVAQTRGWEPAEKAAFWQELAKQIEARHSPAGSPCPFGGRTVNTFSPDGSSGFIGWLSTAVVTCSSSAKISM